MNRPLVFLIAPPTGAAGVSPTVPKLMRISILAHERKNARTNAKENRSGAK
jgi:hypothetical protein